MGGYLPGEELEGISLVSSGTSVDSGHFMLYKYCYSAREDSDDTGFRLIKKVGYQKDNFLTKRK